MDEQTHRLFKTSINTQFARIAKAVAAPSRFELVDVLTQGERNVDELAQACGLTIANASQHLQALREAQLVYSRKVGLYVFYRLADPAIAQLIHLIRDIAARQLAEVDRLVDTYLSSRHELDAITMDELVQRLDNPEIVVLDVRPVLEDNHGHSKGARSLPLDDLRAELAKLPRDRQIIAYCRGTYCVFADEAVELLSAEGYQVQRMTEGYTEWLVAGLPIETVASD